jgi:hypothetical protein
VLLCLLLSSGLSPLRAQWVENGVAVCDTTFFRNYPRIISDGCGGAIITWYEERGTMWSDIYAQRVDADGFFLWDSCGAAVCTATDDQNEQEIVSDGAGGAIITWEDYRNGDHKIYAQRIGAGGAPLWAEDGVAVAEGDNQYSPEIVATDAIGAIITWYEYQIGSGNNIYAQRISMFGTLLWSGSGIAVCTSAENSENPKITTDGAYGAIIAWHDDIYAQRVNQWGNIMWLESGLPIYIAPGYQSSPRICSDGDGGAFITWIDDSVYIQRVDADGSKLWTEDGIAVCPLSSPQTGPEVIADGAGGAIITWMDERSGDLDIYAQRIDADGTVLWDENGVAVCTAAEDQAGDDIVTDGACGAIVTWVDQRNGIDSDIYAQRVDSNGNAMWTADGVPVCTAAGGQGFPRIAADGAGGAFITWRDSRSGNYDIYVLRVDRNGNSPPVAVPDIPHVNALSQNYPNPFNPHTRISYSVREPTSVILTIYDCTGKYIRTLIDAHHEPGRYEVQWNGTDHSGRSAASGVYFCRLTTRSFEETRKMVLLR